MVGLLLDLLLWVQEQRAPFSIHDLADTLDHSVRSAWRYASMLETRGLIEKVSTGYPGQIALWKTVR